MMFLGQYKPQTFMKGRVNGQFIIEGLASGLLFVLGAVGVIVLDYPHGVDMSVKNRFVVLGVGATCLAVAYIATYVFLTNKIPGYQA